MITALHDAIIFTGGALVERQALLLIGGKVVDIVSDRNIPSDSRRVSCADTVLVPGFIDVQVNGGGGFQFNNDPSVETCLAIARAHRRCGTTRLLQTCMTDTEEVRQKALVSIRSARAQDESILGIHFEGPYLQELARRIHPAEHIRTMADEDVPFYRPQSDEIMLMTVAPGMAEPEQVKKLCAMGVIVSLGHCETTPDCVRPMLEAGATGFTHLFNSMGAMSARDPGMAGLALDDAESWCGLIADGAHVRPEMIRLALRAKMPGKIFLVSDAMAPAGCEVKAPFILYGETIYIEDGYCLDSRGCLAGSPRTLAEDLRYCIKEIGVELEEAARMASTYPAEFLGLERRFGKLLPGYEADIVALDSDFVPSRVWVSGKEVGGVR